MAPDRTEAEEMIVAQFGQNMRRARRRAGLSQADLGDRAGLHRTAIGMLERGQRMPRLGTVVRIAAALDVPLGELMDRMSWTPPGPRPTPAGGFAVGNDAVSS